MRFGLKDVSELPSMEEFEKMAAIELDDTPDNAAQAAEGEAANEVSAELSLELDDEASQEPEDEAVAMTAENETTTEPVPGGTDQTKD